MYQRVGICVILAPVQAIITAVFGAYGGDRDKRFARSTKGPPGKLTQSRMAKLQIGGDATCALYRVALFAEETMSHREGHKA